MTTVPLLADASSAPPGLVAGALAAYVVLAVGYVLLGRGLARRLGVPDRGVEGFAYATALGTGTASLALFAAAALGATRGLAPGLSTSCGVACLCALAGFCVARGRRGAAAGLPAAPDAEGRRWLAPPLVLAAFQVLSACAPETGWDALSYHLPAAFRLWADGAGPTVGLLDGEGRLGADLLVAPALASWRGAPPVGAALLHALASLALAAALSAEVRRRVGPRAASAVATLWLAAPVVADLAGTASIDLWVGLYGFVALASAARAVRGEGGHAALAAGLCAGFAANAKLTGLAFVVATALVLLVGLGRRAGARPTALACGVAALVAAPWALRALLNTGNPVFPALAGPFGSGWADPAVVRATTTTVLEQTGLARGPWLPLTGTLHGALDGAFAFELPVWLLALAPAALTRRRRREASGLLAGGLLAWAAWGLVVPYVRFGYAVFAWAAVAAAVGASRLATAWPRLRPAVAVLGVALVALAIRDADRAAGRVAAVASWAVGGALPVGHDFAADGRVHVAAWAAADGAPGRALVVGAPAGLAGPRGTSSDEVRNGLALEADLGDPARLAALLRGVGASVVVHRLDHLRSASPVERGLRALVAGRPVREGPPPLAPPRRHDWFWVEVPRGP